MKISGIAHWTGGLIALALINIGKPTHGAEPAAGDDLTKASPSPDLQVHEWGTFTTLHRPDGDGLSWYQDTSKTVSELPSFVHSFLPGMKSRSRGPHTARMETPVLYFYTDQKQVVNVSANYEGGIITQFYPQKWQALELFPPREAGHLLKELPIDPKRPDNHYYEARAVPEAALIRSARGPDKDGKPRSAEIERFLFYRGVGTFDTRLKPKLSAGGKLTLEHYHQEIELKHAWILQSSADAIRWVKTDPFLKWIPGERLSQVKIQLNEMNPHSSRKESVARLIDSMETALIDSGLTQAEAAAMVATWDEQWYEEPGQRVFTIPAQDLIDQILPLEISPEPSSLVRVFVHRQEMLTPETIEAIELSMKPETKAEQARKIIHREQLGRFVHGTLGAVADDVANRTRMEYYNRGLTALVLQSMKDKNHDQSDDLALQK